MQRAFYYGNVLAAEGAVDAAPDPAEVEATTMETDTTDDKGPTMVWVGVVLLLVLIRVLQEWRGKGE